MEWTIEKVRQLPEDNWLGIRRVGFHLWQISTQDGSGITMWTGDGGILEYIKTLEEEMKNYGVA